MVTNVRENRHGANDTVTLTVERLTHGGEGIGPQLDGSHPGRMVFVRGTCPGDRVEVRLTTARKRFARGVLSRIIEAGPGRVEPPCDHASRCGGCSWQHIAPETQRDALEGNLKFMFRGLTDSRTQLMELRSGFPLGYRTRIRLHAKWTVAGLDLGFREHRGHGIVSVSSCPVATPAFEAVMGSLRSFLQRFVEEPRGEGSVALMEDGRGALFLSLRGKWKPELLDCIDELSLAGIALNTGGRVLWAGERYGQWQQGEDRPVLRILNGGFTQANTAVLGMLLADLQHEWEQVQPQKVLELFCGAGTLTIPLMHPEVERWVAVDGAEDAVATLRDSLGDEKRLLCFAGRDPDTLPQPCYERVDLVLMDPPREGAADWLDLVARGSAQTILYVSCDPATQVRDVRTLCESGYELVRLYGYDMFPNTGHMESLAVLKQVDRGVEHE